MHNVKGDEFDRRLSQLEDHSRKIPRINLASSGMPRPQGVVGEAASMTPPMALPATTTPPSAKTRQLEPAIELMPPAPPQTSRESGLSSTHLSAGSSHGSQEAQNRDTPMSNNHLPSIQPGSSGKPAMVQRNDPATVMPQGSITKEQPQQQTAPVERDDSLLKLFRRWSTTRN